MKLNTFQRMIQQHAFKAHKLNAITDEQYQEYVARAHSYNEEEHAHLGEELDELWRAALNKKHAESNAIYAARDKEWKEKVASWAYQKNRRFSCPPALQFQLWETAKAARAIRAIKNREMRWLRKEMREADEAWLQELLGRVAVAIARKREEEAARLAAVKEERRRVSCPPVEAFKFWDCVKRASRMRLITNAQVRECRKIRNWGDRLEISKKRFELLEAIHTKLENSALKKSLRQRQKERATFLNQTN